MSKAYQAVTGPVVVEDRGDESMAEKPTYEELEQRVAFLERKSEQRKRSEAINTALFAISHAVNTTSGLDELFHTIHASLTPILDTTNFYISLYNQTDDKLTFPYVVDTVDECYPPVIEISKMESLTAEVIRTCAPLKVSKDEVLRRRLESSYKIPDCTPAEIWLGVPLKTHQSLVGVMAVQNYRDPLCYDQTDMDVMVSVADQVGLAIERKQAEMEREELIGKLETALLEVKTLQGIIPICSHCKNIRDDKGYWQRIERYVKERSDAEFSHSVCPECLKKYYSEVDEL